MSVSGWKRWSQAPQTLGWRRLLLKIHLWLGLVFGVYLVVICVSGSAVVLRPQFAQWFIHSRVASTEGDPLQGAALEAAIRNAYPGRTISFIQTPRMPGRAVYLGLEKGDGDETRFFDHYAGTDLGSNHPWQVETMEWLVDFHDNLLSNETGRNINGLGGALFVLMVLSGLILWWPGRSRWLRSVIPLRDNPRPLLWHLHSIVGLWLAFLMLVWGGTAVYFAMPAPFEGLVDWLDDDLNDYERPDGFLISMVRLHFGRFGGMWGRVTWMLLGLVPVFMYLSGFWLWWKSRKQKT